MATTGPLSDTPVAGDRTALIPVTVPDSASAEGSDAEKGQTFRWHEGGRVLVMHLLGGIGGADGEPPPAWTVTGHFAFGEACVVRDPQSGDRRSQIRYHQNLR